MMTPTSGEWLGGIRFRSGWRRTAGEAAYWRSPGSAPQQRRREHYRTFVSVIANRGDTEIEVVDDHVFQGVARGIRWYPARPAPLRIGGRAPVDLVSGQGRGVYRIPLQRGRRLHGAADAHVRRSRRCPRQRRERDRIHGRELRGVIEVHVLDDVAILDSVFGANVLMLPHVVLVRL